MKNDISVIIPIYNSKLYLQEAIDSILLQKENLCELLLIDDGSTDGSSDFIENLYSNNELIKIIHTENKGQGNARNIGTQIATGNFIYYFDSDDISSPDLLKRFHNLLSDIPDLELFCFSGESFLDPNTSIENISNPGELSKLAFKRKINTPCRSGEEAFKLLVENNSFIPGPPLYIFKKSILSENNIKFGHMKYEDEEFTHKLFIYAGQAYITNDVLFYRRVRKGSTMQLNRTFQDLLGYFKTIETLNKLKTLEFISNETVRLLEKRIINFVRMIIIIKAANKIIMTKEQRKIFLKNIKPFLKENKDLYRFYYQYPIEYKLRMLKSKYFDKYLLFYS